MENFFFTKWKKFATKRKHFQERIYWILNHIIIENSIKSKLNTLGELGCIIGIIEKFYKNMIFMEVNS
jgi:hypothetical protein